MTQQPDSATAWKALAEEGFPVYLRQQDADHLLAAVEWALVQPGLDLGPGLRKALVEEAGRRVERVFEMLRRAGVPAADNIGADTRLAIEMRALESLADEHDAFLALAGELAGAAAEFVNGLLSSRGPLRTVDEEEEAAQRYQRVAAAIARYHEVIAPAQHHEQAASWRGETGQGCPETVWDGPHAMRCGLGGDGAVCARHGRFAADAPSAEAKPPCSVCGGRGWHTAGGNDPGACGHCAAGELWYSGDPSPTGGGADGCDCGHPWFAHDSHGCGVDGFLDGPCPCKRTGPHENQPDAVALVARVAVVKRDRDEAVRCESRAVADMHGERARAEAAEAALEPFSRVCVLGMPDDTRFKLEPLTVADFRRAQAILESRATSTASTEGERD